MRLRRSRIAGALTCLFAAGVIGWGGYQAQSALSGLREAEAALGSRPALHASNTDAKGDRLPFIRNRMAVAPTVNAPFALAALDPNPTIVAPPPTSTEPPNEPAETAAVPSGTVSVPAPQAERPKPAPPKQTNALLDDAQIASIKSRLRLTATQEEYWPPVEAALRDVVRQQMREARKRRALAPAKIDVNSPEVQRLTWAAMPLLMRMREDQKREIRTLARVIGLDQVASQI